MKIGIKKTIPLALVFSILVAFLAAHSCSKKALPVLDAGLPGLIDAGVAGIADESGVAVESDASDETGIFVAPEFPDFSEKFSGKYDIRFGAGACIPGTGTGQAQDATAQCIAAKYGLSIPVGGTGTGLCQDATLQAILGAIPDAGGGGSVVLAGDVTGASNANEVVGILSHALPSLSLGYLNWNGSAWVFTAGSAIFTPGADLSGNGTSTATLQYVSSLSYSSSAAGGTIPINGTGTTLQFANNNTAPALTVAAKTTDTATVPLLIQSQAPFSGAVTNLTPGPLVFNIPAPVSGTGYGMVSVQEGGANAWRFGYIVGGTTPGIYAATAAPSSSNYLLTGDGSSTTALNAPSGGTVFVRTGATNSATFTGATVTLLAPQVAWFSSVTAPNIVHAALASTSAGSGAAGQPMSVTAQAGQAATGAGNNGGAGASLNLAPGQGGTSGSATNGSPGFVVAALPAPLSGGAESLFQVNRGGSFSAGIGPLAGAGASFAALYLGPSITPTANNSSLYTDGTNLHVNAPGSGSISFAAANGTIKQQFTATLSAFAAPLGGLSTSPLSFSGQTSPNTVACGTGGTQTISAAQAIIPFFLVTTGTLSSNCILDFGTNEVTGHSILDFSGVGTLGSFSVQIKNGTATQSITSTTIPTNAVTVYTYGTNGLAVVGIPSSSGGSAPTLHTQTFTSSGTFTPASTVSVVNVCGFGGGGGGGGVATANAGLGSGAGGGGAIQTCVNGLTVTPSSGITVTIGAGGTGSAGTTNGGVGADTTFGALATFSGASGGADYNGNALVPGGQAFKASGGTNAFEMMQLNPSALIPDFSGYTFLAGGGFGASAGITQLAGYRNVAGGFAGGAIGTTNINAGGGGGGAGPGGAGGAGGLGGATAGGVGAAAGANTGAGGGGAGTGGTTGASGGNGGSGSLTVTWIQ